MAVAPSPNLLLLLLFFYITQAWAQEPQAWNVTGAVGGVAFLSPRNPTEYFQIHWRQEDKMKIASRMRGKEPRYPESPLKGRLELLANATLRMSHLQLGDSGEYVLYLENDAGRESRESIWLKVYDLVPKPVVTATTHGDPQQCHTTLRCSVDLQGVTYEWIPPQKVLEKEGPVLKVSLDPAGDTYVCKVTNPVSSNSSSLTFSPPCSWTAGSSSVTSATPSSLVALGHLVLLVLLVLLVTMA